METAELSATEIRITPDPSERDGLSVIADSTPYRELGLGIIRNDATPSGDTEYAWLHAPEVALLRDYLTAWLRMVAAVDDGYSPDSSIAAP